MRALESRADDRSPIRAQLLRPAERDQVDAELLRRANNLFVAAADAGFELDVSHAPRTVPGEELTAPFPGLMLRLVAECGDRLLVVHVQDDDVEFALLRELEHRHRGERGRDRAFEGHENAMEDTWPLRFGRDDDERLRERFCDLERSRSHGVRDGSSGADHHRGDIRLRPFVDEALDRRPGSQVQLEPGGRGSAPRNCVSVFADVKRLHV